MKNVFEVITLPFVNGGNAKQFITGAGPERGHPMEFDEFLRKRLFAHPFSQ